MCKDLMQAFAHASLGMIKKSLDSELIFDIMAVTLFVVTMSYDFVSSMLYNFVSLCIIHSYSVAVLLEWLAEVPVGVLVWM